MKRFYSAASVVLLLLLCPPFVDVALAQFFISTRIGDFDWTCAKDDGTPISGHTRWDKARESCEAYSIGNGLVPYRLIPAQYRFVATAAAQPRAGSPPVNVESTVLLPPIWRPFPPLTPFETGVESTFDLTPYCYSPQGTPRTIAAIDALPTGVTLSTGVITIADTAAAFDEEIGFSCDDGTSFVVTSLPLSLVAVSNELREMGFGLSTATIPEAQTYDLTVGREDTLFPDTFDEQWTADVDVTGCGITPIADQVTLLAYPGTGPTLSYGWLRYTIDPPDVAADCVLTAVISGFVNDTSAMDTVVAAAFDTFTLDVTADEAPPGGAVYFTDTTLQPPTLVTPTTYDTKAEIAAACESTKVTGLGYTVSGQLITGPGTIYECIGTSSTDLLIDLSGTDSSNVLTYPLWLSNWRSVIVRGVEFDMAVQAGNDVNDLPGRRCSPTCVDAASSNPRPRIPYGGGVIRINNYGHTFVEGVHMKMNGHNGDCIIWRTAYNTWNVTPTPTANQRAALVFTLQNSKCEGREGQSGNYSLHADLFHTQGAASDWDTPGAVRFENVTDVSGQEGVVINIYGGSIPHSTLRNYNYRRSTEWDLPNDDNTGGSPFAIGYAAYPSGFAIDNFYYNNGSTYNVGVNRPPNQPLGASNCSSTSGLIIVAEMSCADPPGGDFVPDDKIGRFYVTPH